MRMRATFEQKGRPFCKEKALGRVFLIILVLLSTINIVFSTPLIKEYGTVSDNYKDYLKKYDIKGLKYLLVFPDGFNSAYLGYYYPYQIRLFSPEEWVFCHELAHHYHYLETGNYQLHTPGFYKMEERLCQHLN